MSVGILIWVRLQMNLSIVNTIMILLAASIIIVAVFRRLRMPSILVYLLVGIIFTPSVGYSAG